METLPSPELCIWTRADSVTGTYPHCFKGSQSSGPCTQENNCNFFLLLQGKNGALVTKLDPCTVGYI
jgi:hypothetical protein